MSQILTCILCNYASGMDGSMDMVETQCAADDVYEEKNRETLVHCIQKGGDVFNEGAVSRHSDVETISSHRDHFTREERCTRIRDETESLITLDNIEFLL